MRNVIDGSAKYYKLRVVFMENTNSHEFTLEIPNGIEHKYLETLYKDVERMFNAMKYQLLVVLPEERLKNHRVPVYVTQDFDQCSSFSLDDYFRTFGLEVKKSNGRVRRVR